MSLAGDGTAEDGSSDTEQVRGRGRQSACERAPAAAEGSQFIVVTAFDADETGHLQAVFGPAEQQSEDRAVRTANALASKHAAAIAWSHDANSAGRIRRADDPLCSRRRARLE